MNVADLGHGVIAVRCAVGLVDVRIKAGARKRSRRQTKAFAKQVIQEDRREWKQRLNWIGASLDEQ